MLVLTVVAAFMLATIARAEPTSAPPACRYDDVLTRHVDYGEWQRTLVDTAHRLPEGYSPPDLAPVSEAGLPGRGKVRSLVMDDLRSLVEEARSAGLELVSVSAYRSYSYQVGTFQSWTKRLGYDRAVEVSARPGHSEHQLGTAIDFGTLGAKAPWDFADWRKTREGAWLAENAWRFGFVMSYPRFRQHIVCYDYEPWHYRYVGPEAAQEIREAELTLREWLWLQQ